MNLPQGRSLPVLMTILLLALSYSTTFSQRIPKNRIKEVQVSIAPGLSTNGHNSAWYFNRISLNILAGLSAGSQNLAIAGISNMNLLHSKGVQIAGMVNVVDRLTLIQKEEIKEDEPLRSDFKGFQLSGMVNFVRDDVTGVQLSSGFNMTHGNTTGAQIGGLGNVTMEDFSGVQLSGLYNIAQESMLGFQIAPLFNASDGYMAGLQMGLVNKNEEMAGKNSTKSKARSLQLGLFNVSNKMGGTQVGLVNKAKVMTGTQVGLINLFSKKPAPSDTRRNGTPIGIINIGSKGSFTRISTNTVFLYNFERSTGNCINCSDTQFGFPIGEGYQKFNQNSLVFSYNPGDWNEEKGFWGVGWKLERLYYVKFTMVPKRTGPQNGQYFFAWSLGTQHVNRAKEFKTDLSLLSNVGFTFGRRYSFMGVHYWYVTARINTYIYQDEQHQIESFLMLADKHTGKFGYGVWPGYAVGIQL